MKKIFAFILPIVLVAGAVTSFIFVFNPASSLGFVSIDINPSVQFITDDDDNVIGVSASNDDGDVILSEQVDVLLGLSIEEATEKIVELAIEYGYLDPDALATDPNALTITTMLDNENDRQENILREKIKTHLENYFKNNGVFAVVLTDLDMEEIVTEAEELGISAGQLKLIKSVQAVYPEFTLEEGINMATKDMMDMLKDLRGAQERVQVKTQYVQQLSEDLTELNLALTTANTELATKQAELAALNLVDITLLDEAGLAEHNVAVDMLEEEIAELEATIAEFQTDVAELQADIAEHQADLSEFETYMDEVEAKKIMKLAQAQTKYQNWLQNKQEKANQVRDAWESFQDDLTEEQRQEIYDYFNNYFSQTEEVEGGEVGAE